MTRQATLAVENKATTEAFMKDNGDKLATFDEVIKLPMRICIRT